MSKYPKYTEVEETIDIQNYPILQGYNDKVVQERKLRGKYQIKKKRRYGSDIDISE